MDNRDGHRIVRYADQWWPVHRRNETQVWEIIEKYSLVPYPADFLGIGRCSCRPCIFSGKDQCATIKLIAPSQFQRVARKEVGTGLTIHRKFSIVELAEQGMPYPASADPYWISVGNSQVFDHPVITDDWVLPAGAYGDSLGPT